MRVCYSVLITRLSVTVSVAVVTHKYPPCGTVGNHLILIFFFLAQLFFSVKWQSRAETPFRSFTTCSRCIYSLVFFLSFIRSLVRFHVTFFFFSFFFSTDSLFLALFSARRIIVYD